MAQWGKGLPLNPDDLSSIPRTYVKEEKENGLHKVVL